MRKTLFTALSIALPALVISCGNETGGNGSSGGSTAASSSGSHGGSSGTSSSSSSTPSGGSSAASSSSSAAAGSSAVAGSSTATSSSATGGKTSTGGATGGKSSAGSTTTAGGTTSPGGTTSAGGASGGAPTSSSKTAAGGAGSGGTASSGTTTGPKGGSTGSTGTGGGYQLKNDPVPSAGCGQALPSKYKAGADTTFKDMTSAGLKREYIVYIPTGYDPSKPYRLLFAWHCMGSSDTGAVNSGYYGVKQNDTTKTTILVAPQGYTDGMPWRSDDKDHTFFDDMLKLFKSDLCIDESRVFSIGFSFGGMETYSLSVARQKDIRAGVGIAPANYNIYVTPNKTHAPIGWMQTTGVSDGTCPWGAGSNRGAEAIAIEHGTDNGCTVPKPVPKWTSGNHLCVDFEGCKPGYPTKICTFNGGHTDVHNEGGVNWIYSEGWKFLSQF